MAEGTSEELAQLIRDNADALAEALTKHPCHITGLHKPDHHVERSCADMKADTLTRALWVLGLDYDDLRSELHPSCGWCHDIPSQEEYRQRLRESWAWAGLPLSPELAADAADKSQPGDPEFVFSLVEGMQGDTTGWVGWGDVVTRSEFPGYRCGKALTALVDAGKLEQTYNGHAQIRIPSDV